MPKPQPQLFAQVGREWRDEKHEGARRLPRNLCERSEVLHEDHHRADRRVEAKRFDVLRDLPNRLVNEPAAGRVVRCRILRQAAPSTHVPRSLEKSAHPFEPARLPWLHLLQRPHEHFVDAQCVRSVSPHDVVRIDDVAARLAHLLVVLAEDHSLVHELEERLGVLHDADVEEHLVPEPRVKKVKDRVLAAADVEVDGHPVVVALLAQGLTIVVRVEDSAGSTSTSRPTAASCSSRARTSGRLSERTASRRRAPAGPPGPPPDESRRAAGRRSGSSSCVTAMGSS